MLKLIRLIFEILLGTAIMLFGLLFAIWGNTKYLGIAIIGIGIFVYFVAIANNPKNADKTSKLKMSSIKRLLTILLCLVVTFIFLFVDINHTDTNTETNANTSTPSITEETTVKTSELGKYSVGIKDHYLSKGLYDEKLIVVVFAFTNESDDTICFDDAINVQAFQNGVELNLYIATNIPGQVDIRDSYKELKPGASYDVPKAYILDDTESNVEIELSNQFVFEPITHTITLN